MRFRETFARHGLALGVARLCVDHADRPCAMAAVTAGGGSHRDGGGVGSAGGAGRWRRDRRG